MQDVQSRMKQLAIHASVGGVTARAVAMRAAAVRAVGMSAVAVNAF